jgi:hypothetical protein
MYFLHAKIIHRCRRPFPHLKSSEICWLYPCFLFSCGDGKVFCALVSLKRRVRSARPKPISHKMGLGRKTFWLLDNGSWTGAYSDEGAPSDFFLYSFYGTDSVNKTLVDSWHLPRSGWSKASLYLVSSMVATERNSFSSTDCRPQDSISIGDEFTEAQRKSWLKHTVFVILQMSDAHALTCIIQCRTCQIPQVVSCTSM